MSEDPTEQRAQSRYISVAEMAADLEAPERTIRTALAKGRLRGLYLGTRAGWRVTREDYDAWKRSLDNQQGRTNMSTAEERYQGVFAGKTFTCPECGTQQVLPAHPHAEQDKTLGTIHVIRCTHCPQEYAICLGDRMHTVGVRQAGEEWSAQNTRDLDWLRRVAQQGW